MRAYSLDLRQKVVAAVERGESTVGEVAATFGVGQTFVKKMLRQHRETGDLSPHPHGGGHTPRLSDKHLNLLRAEVAPSPDKTVPALRDHLAERAGLSVSTPTVSRALSRLGLSSKKTLAASERNNYQRGWYWRRVRWLNHRRLIFLDESAVNTAMTPRHGRALRGERVVDHVPRGYGEQTTIVGALSFGRGIIAVMTLVGAVDTLAFDAYLARVLGPRLRKGDVVVLDNLNVHKASQVEEVAARRGACTVAGALLARHARPLSNAGQSSRPACERRRRARGKS
jgi:transposase